MDTLTWSLLSPADTHRCLVAGDVVALHALLRSLDETTGNGQLLRPRGAKRTAAQVDILLDLYAHLIRFARSHGMGADKTSTLVSIVHTMHERSMAERLTRAASYDVLRRLVVQHSVAQPPYAAAIFDLDDVQAMDVYLLASYYRHYKMYAYAFMPRETATLRTVALGDVWATTTAAATGGGDGGAQRCDVEGAGGVYAVSSLLPLTLPPCATAAPRDVWRARVQAEACVREEAALVAHDAASAAAEEARMRDAGLHGPHYTVGVREQLMHIRDTVAAESLSRLDAIEAKLTVLEGHVNETLHGRSTPLRAASRK